MEERSQAKEQLFQLPPNLKTSCWFRHPSCLNRSLRGVERTRSCREEKERYFRCLLASGRLRLVLRVERRPVGGDLILSTTL